jgi:dTDP-glucose 4,6-dehydratase
VDDLVEGIYRLLLSDYHMPVNIGNPAEITIKQFADEVLALVGNPKAFLDYRVLPVDDPKQRQPNITKAREILGWEPQYDREKGLAITHEYFKKVVKPL